MNKIQLRRWGDFSIRMSLHGWSPKETARKEHQQIVIPSVGGFFDHIKHDYADDIIRIESWDDTRTDRSIRDQWGHHPIGPYVCDIMSIYLTDDNPFHYWDPFDTDEQYEKAYECWDELWGSRIRCCIRAGIDMASSPSGGVVGFEKSSIEKMYPEGVPRWITGEWYLGDPRRTGSHRIDWADIEPSQSLWL